LRSNRRRRASSPLRPAPPPEQPKAIPESQHVVGPLDQRAGQPSAEQPDGDRPVAGSETASPPPVDATTAKVAKKSSAPKKRSRKKTVYQTPQGKRAGAVLDLIFKDGNYPAKTEIAWIDLWDRFCKAYEVYTKSNPSKLSMPSQRVVRRKLGWD